MCFFGKSFKAPAVPTYAPPPEVAPKPAEEVIKERDEEVIKETRKVQEKQAQAVSEKKLLGKTGYVGIPDEEDDDIFSI